jgi:hypothetical protein
MEGDGFSYGVGFENSVREVVEVVGNHGSVNSEQSKMILLN